MQKEGKIEKKLSPEEILFLEQIGDALEETLPKVEVAYNQKDRRTLEHMGKFLLLLQEKISEVIDNE